MFWQQRGDIVCNKKRTYISNSEHVTCYDVSKNSQPRTMYYSMSHFCKSYIYEYNTYDIDCIDVTAV